MELMTMKRRPFAMAAKMYAKNENVVSKLMNKLGAKEPTMAFNFVTAHKRTANDAHSRGTAAKITRF